jgi:hypothetical protein
MSSVYHMALGALPAARFRETGASLPFPSLDPNPRLTLALHKLWEFFLGFMDFDENTDKLFPLAQRFLKSPSETVMLIGSELVSSHLF